jgi:hypothetical protein
MTLEELLATVKEGTTTKENVFSYFGVRNIEGLEIVLEEKTKEVIGRLDYVSSGFEYVYTAREKEVYNPIEEQYLYFLTVLPGFYKIEPEEINALIKGLGTIEGVMLLDKVFSDKKEMKYFNKLYVDYLAERRNIYRLLDQGINKFNAFLDEKIGNLNMEELKKMGQELVGELSKIKPE